MSSKTRAQSAKEIVRQARGLTPDEREEFITKACDGDELLQTQVAMLIGSLEIDLAAAEAASSAAAEEEPARRRKTSAGQKRRKRKEKIAPGQKLQRYEIIEKIGAGGMGEVFLAVDTRLGRRVAIKVIAKKFARDKEGIRRFVQEARAVSALNHPNIITIYEIGESESDAGGGSGRHFIVSEFIQGETLRERLGRSGGGESPPLPLATVLEMAAQILRALAAAHAAGVVHRDIKPENIMIRADGIVKILDFGLAKLINPDLMKTAKISLVDTNPGVLMGTIRYLSPEQARGRGDLDGRSDIFSFGIVLYEMLARRVPFAGESLAETCAAILNQEPASLRGLRPELPFEIEEIVSKALRKDRQERYQTAAEFLNDLQSLRRRLELEAEFGRISSAGEKQAFPSENQTEVLEASVSLSASSALPSNNLSENFTPIVGREREIAQIKDLLLQSGVRLLTLTGIGGTGKTTLAKTAARELLGEFTGGVFFIELSAISDAELVIATIAQPLGVREAGGKRLLAALKDYLRARPTRILLVLDNFEQVAPAAAPQIAELLAAAPNLKILTTSRALLRLSAEREFMVPPLALPGAEMSDSLADLSECEAVKLFVERARSVKSGFSLTEENASPIAEICRRLDGLPLAIELAAARVKILSPQMILARLENRLQLLTGGALDLPARQQTMRGAIEWSYDLLDENEKSLFRRLSVFAGGFTFAAAEAVGENYESRIANRDLDKSEIRRLQPAINILDGITSLVDKSLLVGKEQADGGEMRFRMLEVVREYALDALERNGEADAMRRAHAEFVLALAEEAEPHLQVSRSAEWLNRLEDEHDNLRAALRWAQTNDASMLVRLAVAVRRFWFLHSHLTEGHGWLRLALERGGNEAPPALRFELLDALGTLARFKGDYETARRAYERALSEGREINDRRQIAESSSGLGLVVFQQGDLSAARRFIEEGLQISREMNDKFNVAASLNSLGDIARTEDNLPEARAFFEESLAISRALNHKQFVGTILANLGAVTYGEGDFDSARTHFSEALTIARELGHRVAVSYSLDGFAALAVTRGEMRTAARLAAAAECLRESLGFEIEPADRRFRESYLTELKNALSGAELEAAFEEGRKMKLKQSVALALTLSEN